MSFNIYTSERQAKIARFLKMIKEKTPVWEPEKFKRIQEEKKKTSSEAKRKETHHI